MVEMLKITDLLCVLVSSELVVYCLYDSQLQSVQNIPIHFVSNVEFFHFVFTHHYLVSYLHNDDYKI